MRTSFFQRWVSGLLRLGAALAVLGGILLPLGGCEAVSDITPATPVPAPRPQTPAPTSTAAPFSVVTPALTSRPTAPVEGAFAPDFTVTDMNGRPLRLSDLRGKRVLLNFWATWCPPCRVELPHLQAAHEKYGKDEFVVLGVDYGESREKVLEFARANKLTFPMALDETGEAMVAYGIRGIPTSFFIDRQGVIVAKQAGVVTPAIIERVLTKMP